MAAKRTTPVVESVENNREVAPVDGKLEMTVTSMYKVNYGDYEAHHLFAAVKGTFEADLDEDEIGEYLDGKLFSLMKPQLVAAKELSIEESFVLRMD